MKRQNSADIQRQQKKMRRKKTQGERSYCLGKNSLGKRKNRK